VPLIRDDKLLITDLTERMRAVTKNIGLGAFREQPQRHLVRPRPAATCSRVRSRVRPVDAAGVAAGPNALRGSGPNRTPALGSAL